MTESAASAGGRCDSDLSYFRGVVVLRGAAVDRAAEAGLASVPEEWHQQLRKRDGEESGYHVTFLTKADLQTVSEKLRDNALQLPERVVPLDLGSLAAVAELAKQLVLASACGLAWVDVGEGRAKGEDGAEAAFRVVLWPGGAAARRVLRLPPADFHISLGFRSRDVHGKQKGLASLVGGANVVARPALSEMVALAQSLLDAGIGRDVNAEGVEQLALAAVEGARIHEDAVSEAGALRVLCNLCGRLGRHEDSLAFAGQLTTIRSNDAVGCRSMAFGLMSMHRYEEALPELKRLRSILPSMHQGKERSGVEKWLPVALKKCCAKLGVPEPLFPGPEDAANADGDRLFEATFHTTRSPLKFPSTCHLKNLGAATRDDKICDAVRQHRFCGGGQIVSVEEKIDGANLGFSLDHVSQVRMQNRSKMVNWNTDPQFAGLEQWINEHRSTLCEILERNNDILFGEWCAACHTVKYTRLPGYFLAFDIFDLRVGRFLSRTSFHTRLQRAKGRKIPAVPTVCPARTFASIAEVQALLQRNSRFADENLEGVYLRIDEAVAAPGLSESYLVDRCKLVRSEFHQAIDEHGNWRGNGKNQLDMEDAFSYPEECYPCALRSTSEEGTGSVPAGVGFTAGYPNSTAASASSAPKLPIAAGKDNYPSTPHLPFSPGVNSDDSLLADCSDLLRGEVVITEKLDGGNCCVKHGQVYARSHAQPASHDSFSAVKQLAQNFAHDLEDIELFGENMQGVHSIEYGNLASYFYVFGARRSGQWLAWDEVVLLADRLGLPLVPVVFRGHFDSPAHLQGSIEAWAQEPSAVGEDVQPEGFVVRRTHGFKGCDFSGCMGKYVRANHIQTDDAWRRTWKKAKLGPALPERPLRSQRAPSALRLKLGNPREKHTLSTSDYGEVELPRNFSFLMNDVAVSSTPTNRSQILAMATLDIILVVTLTEETPLPEAWFTGSGVRNMFVPVRNYHAPTVPQVDEILVALAKVASSGKKVMVHCGGGKGRAGTVAACVMLRYGTESVSDALGLERVRGCMQQCAMQSDELLRHLRDERPGSVETERQERFIRCFASTLWQRGQEAQLFDKEDGDEASGLAAAATADGDRHQPMAARFAAKGRREDKDAERRLKEALKRAPKYILMVGLAGSGKSTFSKRLEASGNWVRANQDDLGRKACVDLVSKTVPLVKQGKTRLVIDRCNLTKRERREWVDAMHAPHPKDIACVFFNFGAEECKQRAAARFDHPTIRAGGGARIIDDQAKALEVPVAVEGFGAVEVVRDFSQAETLLRRYGGVVDDGPLQTNDAHPTAGAVAPKPNAVSESTSESSPCVQETSAEMVSESQLPEDSVLPLEFSAWLQTALSQELNESEVDSIFAAVEVILAGADTDPEALASAADVARDSGAERCADGLTARWLAAAAGV